MHYVGQFDEATLAPHATYADHSQGYTSSALVDSTQGSLHTGLGVNQLAGGGTLSPHVHSYEEGFYVLEGQVLASIGEKSQLLGPGDYGVIKVGTLHSWRNAGSQSARWLEMAAPQPRSGGGDTFFAEGAEIPTDAAPFDPGNPGDSLLGHFDLGQVPSIGERETAAGLEGVFLNWIMDEKFGARHHRWAFIEYQPGVGIGLHDHAFEESYFILKGEIDATLDGEHYHAKPGDVLWTGVGCLHSFKNNSSEPVCWLETFSPQPPAENAFRFAAEWKKRAAELAGNN
jgi:quercetin dioxygenase-like cupin family protein